MLKLDCWFTEKTIVTFVEDRPAGVVTARKHSSRIQSQWFLVKRLFGFVETGDDGTADNFIVGKKPAAVCANNEVMVWQFRIAVTKAKAPPLCAVLSKCLETVRRSHAACHHFLLRLTNASSRTSLATRLHAPSLFPVFLMIFRRCCVYRTS